MIDLPTDVTYELKPGTLLHLLANSIILENTAPYLTPAAIFSLATTCRAFHTLLYGSPFIFRCLDLSITKLARGGTEAAAEFYRQSWQSYDNIDEDGDNSNDVNESQETKPQPELCSPDGPLGGSLYSLRRTGWLSNVQTLILDGVPVALNVILRLFFHPDYNVRILSLRGLGIDWDDDIQEELVRWCRETRDAAHVKPSSLPLRQRHRGLYILNSASRGTDEEWYHRGGSVVGSRASQLLGAARWARTLVECRNLIAFDGVLCTAPLHQNSQAFRANPDSTDSLSNPVLPCFLAACALRGCASCDDPPGGWTTWGDFSEKTDDYQYGCRFPLLYPPPVKSSSLRAAMCPGGQPLHPQSACGQTTTTSNPARFIPRCSSCVTNRTCSSCNRWWCESCKPAHAINLAEDVVLRRSCLECGSILCQLISFGAALPSIPDLVQPLLR